MKKRSFIISVLITALVSSCGGSGEKVSTVMDKSNIQECEGSFSGAIIGDVYGKTYMYPSFVLYENYEDRKERIELSDDLPF